MINYERNDKGQTTKYWLTDLSPHPALPWKGRVCEGVLVMRADKLLRHYVPRKKPSGLISPGSLEETTIENPMGLNRNNLR